MRSLRARLPLLCLVLCCALVQALSSATAVSQQPTAHVQGVVVAADTNAPLSKVRVELRSADGGSVLRTTETDPDGFFFFPGTPVGEYSFLARRLGFVTAEYAQPGPGAPGVSVVAAADAVVNVPIYMHRGGVIAGRVTDNGRGFGLADVAALRAVYVDGELHQEMVISDRADDLGNFRLYWLPPGEYMVVAVVRDTRGNIPDYMTADGDNSDSIYLERRALRAVLNRATGSGISGDEAHIPVYYPGTADPASAAFIRVQSGVELTGINIDASPRPTYRVAGRISGFDAAVNSEGSPVPPRIRMFPARGIVQSSETQAPAVGANPDGTFDIPRVSPGVYTLTAEAGSLAARRTLEIRGRDVLNANLTLGEGYPLSGQLVIEGEVESSLRIRLLEDPAVTSWTYDATLNEDGSFTIPRSETNMAPPPGAYRVFVDPILVPPSFTANRTVPESLEGVYVKSITLGDRDVLDQGLEVTGPVREPLVVVVGTNPGALQGQVVNTRGEAAAAVRVALIPDNNLRYRIDHPSASTDPEGRFTIANVPPGDYRVYAWDYALEDAWQNPAFMRTYEDLGTRVRIEEGGVSSLDLTSIPAGL